MSAAVIALLCALSLTLGAGGTLGVQLALRGRDDSAEELVQATAQVAEAAGRGASDAVTAAMGPAATEAQARLEFAGTPAVNIAVEAAVDPGASPRTVALAAYLGCLAASQAQAQGAAAFGCPERGKALDATLKVEGER
jgi:hypothetical protein